ncbi:MAG TPA: hypothetical protein VID48_09930 [Solirubrobacteraceae bacterium]|jgi:hypothetical protein
MSRAKAATGGRPFGARRLAVVGMTAGLLAAGTGGVIAATSGGGSTGNAAVAQYSSSACDQGNNNSNNNSNGEGSENNNGNNNFNCDGSISIGNGSGNGSGNTTNNNSSSNTTTNNYYTSTLSAGPTAAALGVQASKQSKASASKRHFSVHFFAGNGKKLRKLTVRLNGKVIKVYKGRIPSTLDFVGVPCGNVKQHLVITGETTSGKKVSETRHYNLCQ